jgi:hypothetical protein
MIEKGFIIRNGIRYGAGVEDANSVVFDNTGLDLASTNMQAVTEELNNTKLTKPEEITLEQYNDMIANGTLDDTKNYIVTGTSDPYFMSGSLIGYDNATSGILADNVQNAIDEVHAESIKTSEKGQANGVATLNEMGVIPSEQINVTGLNVKGTWNADSNTPALSNGNGENGDFYIVNTAGSADFGAGEISFAVGDWVLYTDNGVWEKSVNASAVQSVNGKTGLVNITADDLLTEAQLGVLNSGISTSDKAQIETNKLDIEGLTTSKQDSLSEDQLKAVDSGIDDVKVAQIETNKNTIATMLTEAEALGQQVVENTTNVGLLQTAATDLRADVDANTTAVAEKLDKATDVANAGKPLVVGDDGAIGFSEAKGKIYTSLEPLGLTGPTTTGEVFVAVPDNSMLMLNVEAFDENTGALRTITDAPKEYGLLAIEKHAPGRHRIEYSSSLGGSASDVRKWIASIKGNDGTGLRWIELTGSAKIYTTMAQLGLDGSTATIQDVINSIGVGEIALLRTDAFDNDNWQTQCNGVRYGYLKVEKTMNGLSNIELQDVTVPNIRYFGRQAGGLFAEWVADLSTTTKGIAQNSKYYKIDMTKGSASWNGIVKFSFNNYQVPTEVTFMITSSEVFYTITEGVNCIKSVTYTINAANVIIGIELNEQVYGTQVAKINGIFGTMNNLTAEQFTCTATAAFKGYGARHITDLQELGLDASATIDNVISSLPLGSTALFPVTVFTNYKTMFPYEDGNDDFGRVLFIKGDADGRIFIRWFRKDGNSEAIGVQSLSDNSFVGWNKINVLTQDKGSTAVTIINPIAGVTNNTANSRINYYIKNGVCCVAVQLLMSIQTPITGWTNVATNLPTPAINISQTTHGERNDSALTMAFRITAGGTLQMIFDGTTTVEEWWTTTFTYPV